MHKKFIFPSDKYLKDIQRKEYTFQPNTILAYKKVFRQASPVTVQSTL
jgi:hypothetical protein